MCSLLSVLQREDPSHSSLSNAAFQKLSREQIMQPDKHSPGGLPGLGPVHHTVLLLSLTEWLHWSPHLPLCSVVNPIRQE